MKKTYYITFYSFKGGVGRTTACLNLAWALANAGRSVFVVELDLEAPSMLELPVFADIRKRAVGGVIDILANPQTDNLQRQLTPLVLDHREGEKLIRVLAAGRPGPEYSTTLAKVDFGGMFESGEGSRLFELLKQTIEDTYTPEFVLIDARTGLTDVGGVAVIQLADLVVVVTTLGEQALAGTHGVWTRLQDAARMGERRVPLETRLLASHVPADLPDLVKAARGNADRLGLKPHYEVRLQPALLVRHEIYTRDYPNDEFIAGPYRKLAVDAIGLRDSVVKAAAREVERGRGERREKTFEERVADLFRLMGFRVEEAGADLLVEEPGKFRSQWYLVQAAESAREWSEEEIELFARRMAAAREKRPELGGMVITPGARTSAAAAGHGIAMESYRGLQDRLVDFGAYNRGLIQAVRGTEIETRYVEPWAEPERGERSRLTELADGFVRDAGANLLVLLGDFGTGKTWFTRRYAAELAERFEREPALERRPMRIDLREVAKELTLESILRYAFPKADTAALLHLMAEGRLVVLFDGFDEMATKADFEVTLSNFRQLARAAAGKAKVILTCRTHYFKDKEESETPLSAEARRVEGFRVATLPVFDEAQIEEYLDRALGEEAGKARRLLEENENLREIARRPVLLDMVVRTVDSLAGMEGRINQSKLYQQYTDEWLQRNDWRLRVTKEIKDALLEELAVRLWETDSAQIHYTELQSALAPLLRDRVSDYESFELAGSEVRTATFLVRDDEGNYRFAHRSFLEFFLARRIARGLRDGAAGDRLLARAARIGELSSEGEATAVLAVRRLSPPVISFVREMAGDEAVRAAAGRVLGDSYVERASENALLLWRSVGGGATRMRLGGARLAGLDLQGLEAEGADLHGADLSGADLTDARLAGADLTDAEMAGAVLDGADWGGARLAGADLRFGSAVEVRGEAEGLERTQRLGLARAVGRGVASARSPALMPTSSVAWQGDLIAVAMGYYIGIFDAVTGQWRRLLTGHEGRIRSAAWSPDGRSLASASEDGSVRLWEPVSGKLLSTLHGHEDAVRSVAWSPDGRSLASASDDQSVRLWDPLSGHLLSALRGHENRVWSVAWSPDGRSLASASDDKSIRIWHPLSGQLLATLRGHEDRVLAVSWSPDGRSLASASADESVRLWDPLSAQLPSILCGHEHWVRSVAWSPDGRSLASTSDDQSVRLWDPLSGRLLATFRGHEDAVRSVAWSSDGRSLASASDDESVRLWDPLSGRLLATFRGHESAVLSVAWSPDGRSLTSASQDESVRLWDPLSGRLLATLRGHEDVVRSVAWSPDGRSLTSASQDESVRLWDPLSGQLLATLRSHEGWVRSVAWSPDGRSLASASDDKSVRIWAPLSGKPLATLRGHEAAVRSVAWSPDGQSLASASSDKSVRFWDPLSGQLLATVRGHKHWVRSIAWSPDGRSLASASDDKSVRIWDPLSGQLLSTLRGHEAAVFSVAWSPDGRPLASASSDKSVRIWDPLSGQLLSALRGHEAAVFSVAWSPDGRWLASASADGTIRLWDPATGQCLAVMRQYEGGRWMTTYEDAEGHIESFVTDEASKPYLKFISPPDWALFGYRAVRHLERKG